MIIDCHCHAGKGDGLIGPWDTAAPLDQYLRRAAKAGINRTVLFAAFHSDYTIANRALARARGRFVLLLNPDVRVSAETLAAAAAALIVAEIERIDRAARKAA